jgi:hypothetical protein
MSSTDTIINILPAIDTPLREADHLKAKGYTVTTEELTERPVLNRENTGLRNFLGDSPPPWQDLQQDHDLLNCYEIYFLHPTRGHHIGNTSHRLRTYCERCQYTKYSTSWALRLARDCLVQSVGSQALRKATATTIPTVLRCHQCWNAKALIDD